jgi:hypothetical protein
MVDTTEGDPRDICARDMEDTDVDIDTDDE